MRKRVGKSDSPEEGKTIIYDPAFRMSNRRTQQLIHLGSSYCSGMEKGHGVTYLGMGR